MAASARILPVGAARRIRDGRVEAPLEAGQGELRGVGQHQRVVGILERRGEREALAAYAAALDSRMRW